PDRHGFDDGEPQAGPANRVEEKPVSRHESRKLDVVDLAQAAEKVRFHSDEIQRHMPARFLEDVRAETPPAPPQMVDHDDAALELAAVIDGLRKDDAMLDD